ncbi:hypothetical protein PMI07_002967 [Rhizobium sp. CF080]|uniref:hypothetical protein n=1 Tax=Rhizobium sp. (strain CF080) TaxID=1144310 RepID=UPI0003E7E127|nr:hypothetical protein [Rhizobium sp. CF080]EUB95189.1 hypothetical protein PMI07_002967 [Rhizobium sp. CF080]
MTRITSAIAAAFIASASFTSVALAAEGEYFEGASKASSTVDNVQTGSIARDQQTANQVPTSVDDGDYYAGANRPN